jgi:hypothetical protein
VPSSALSSQYRLTEQVAVAVTLLRPVFWKRTDRISAKAPSILKFLWLSLVTPSKFWDTTYNSACCLLHAGFFLRQCVLRNVCRLSPDRTLRNHRRENLRSNLMVSPSLDVWFCTYSVIYNRC